jgi:pyrroline-5-carboxylate reductase
MNITFIGGGNMASALISGLAKQGSITDSVRVSDPDEGARGRLSAEFGIQCFETAEPACQQADVIVLAVKPQIMDRVLTGLAKVIEGSPLFLTVAAGLTVSYYLDRLGQQAAVVRSMPNTPALLGAGATGLFASQNCTDAQRQAADTVMRAAGVTVWVEDESLIDVITAISGSGPAYYYLLTEALTEAGCKLGLEQTVASQLAVQTAYGAGVMAIHGGADVAELRRRVTSPGGTTQAAIASFQENGLDQLVLAAAEAAVYRGRELAAEATRS